jgi:hypothetical protein
VPLTYPRVRYGSVVLTTESPVSTRKCATGRTLVRWRHWEAMPIRQTNRRTAMSRQRTAHQHCGGPREVANPIIALRYGWSPIYRTTHRGGEATQSAATRLTSVRIRSMRLTGDSRPRPEQGSRTDPRMEGDWHGRRHRLESGCGLVARPEFDSLALR